MKLKDFWGEEFYNDVINGCPCEKCLALRKKLGQSFETLTEEEREYFKEIVKGTYDRLVWGV